MKKYFIYDRKMELYLPKLERGICMNVIGIDLGTSNTLGCVFRDVEAVLIPNREGSYLTKSAVSVMDDTIITGRAAKERLFHDVHDLLVGFLTPKPDVL